ncbi:MAG: adenosylhomocysteinase [Candidatus Altiarchaeota archaeon]|nr:adenosylhomocysteinase [Candidatus Altiarchaeota archaeon]
MSKVKDIRLAAQGALKVDWAESHMPVLMEIRKQFTAKKPLRGVTVGFALHVTKETAVLVRTLVAGGARVAIAGCNPLSTQDDVAAALAKEGVDVYAWRGQSAKEYYENLNKVLDHKPQITIDDGGDLVFTIHKHRRELLSVVKGGCEETTTGVIRLRAMEKDNALEYAVIATNDADTKHMFDNHYGTGQSTLDGILRSTNILFSGKTVVVAGYGWCGKGIAMRSQGMGANVIVCEVDPVKALQAAMDGYRVMPMDSASSIGDIFITATGDIDIICERHIRKMKDGAVLANSGHFNVEIVVPDLEKLSAGKKVMRDNVVMYTLKGGKRIYLLAEGRLVNLAAAEGHPSEVMDMSFADQALSCAYINKNKLAPGVYPVPVEIDSLVAKMKLATMGIRIDSLTARQKEYLSGWEEGT